jgi:hypothetical protein
VFFSLLDGDSISANPPNAPSGLFLVAVGQTTATISWTDNDTNEITFRVERKLFTDPPGNYVEVGFTPAAP